MLAGRWPLDSIVVQDGAAQTMAPEPRRRLPRGCDLLLTRSHGTRRTGIAPAIWSATAPSIPNGRQIFLSVTRRGVSSAATVTGLRVGPAVWSPDLCRVRSRETDTRLASRVRVGNMRSHRGQGKPLGLRFVALSVGWTESVRVFARLRSFPALSVAMLSVGRLAHSRDSIARPALRGQWPVRSGQRRAG